MKKIIAANWKMCGNLEFIREHIKALSTGISKNNKDIILFPSSLFLKTVSDHLLEIESPINLGAQDVSAFNNGAYTGQISAKMLSDLKVKYVLIGHSERRKYCSEENEELLEKLTRALENNLIPIFCFGEELASYQQGKTGEVISQQLSFILELANKLVNFENIVFAYEPVWAIGTGLSASEEHIQKVLLFLQNFFSTKLPNLEKLPQILYGGSVNQGNAGSLLKLSGLDGLLVGGASLKTLEFISICEG